MLKFTTHFVWVGKHKRIILAQKQFNFIKNKMYLFFCCKTENKVHVLNPYPSVHFDACYRGQRYILLDFPIYTEIP